MLENIDCFWKAIGICDKVCTCNSYVSFFSEDGSKLNKEYQSQLNEPIKLIDAINEKWEAKLKEGD